MSQVSSYLESFSSTISLNSLSFAALRAESCTLYSNSCRCIDKKLSGRETKSSTFSMLLFHFSKNASTSLRCPVVLLLEDPSRWTSLLAQVCTRHLLWSISCPVTNASPARATVWLVRFAVSEMKMSNVFQCSTDFKLTYPCYTYAYNIYIYIYQKKHV